MMKKLIKMSLCALLSAALCLGFAGAAGATSASETDLNADISADASVSVPADIEPGITVQYGNTYTENAQRLYGGDTSDITDEALAQWLEECSALSNSAIEELVEQNQGYIDGYCISSLDVDITANANRSFDIIETWDVYFTELSHGITRYLPSYGSTEMYEIRNFDVAGAPWIFYGDNTVRIGSSEKLVSGLQRYVISYSLVYYEDPYPDYDRLYLNIVGDQIDTMTFNMTSRLRLPEGVEPQDDMLMSGESSTSNSCDVKKIYSDGIYYFYCESLRPQNSVTIDVKLLDGAYSEDALLVPDITVDNLAVEIEADKYGVFNVTEDYTLTINSDDASFYRKPQISFINSNGQAIIRNISCTFPDGEEKSVLENIDHVYTTFTGQSGTQTNIVISYQLEASIANHHMDTTAFNLTDFDDPDSAGSCIYKNIVIKARAYDDAYNNFDAPIMISASNPYHSLMADTGEADAFSFEQSTMRDGTLLLQSSGKMPVGDIVDLTISAPDGVFARRPMVADFALPAAMLIVLWGMGGLALARKRSNKTIVPTVEYYPPDGLNPAEVGFIIDGTADASDIPPLIYYWAADGHLSIEITSKKHYTLHKLAELDDAHRPYEKTLFNAIFSRGDGLSVTDTRLNEYMYSYVERASRSVKTIYTERTPIEDERSVLCSLLIRIVPSVVFFILSTVILMTNQFTGQSAVGKIMVLVVLYVISNLMQLSIEKSRFESVKKPVAQTIFRMIFFVIMVAISYSMGGMAIAGISLALSLILAFVTSSLSKMAFKKTDYGVDIIGRCTGFRNFIKTAEKERLEMLLEENPGYYYEILPYAQVMGVTKLWTEKFDGLLKTVPSWYYGDTGLTPYLVSRSLMNNMGRMNRTLNSQPVQTGSGGFGNSGFGGGFSGGGGFGGGFSGGGGGGGGIGRW